jgi:hypothetical protein
MIDKLKEFLDRDPFVPFRILVTSGGSYDVSFPYQVAIGQTQFDYYYPRSDRSAVVRASQVVAFETLEESSAA